MAPQVWAYATTGKALPLTKKGKTTAGADLGGEDQETNF